MLKKYILPAIFIMSLLWALVLAAQRILLENHDRYVEIAVDGDGLFDLARRTGKSFPQALAEMKASGATALAISEDTLSSLKKRGRIDIIYGSRLNPIFSSPRCTYILPEDNSLNKRLAERLSGLLGQDRIKVYNDSGTPVIRLTAVDPDLEEEAGLGFDAGLIELARQAGLPVVLRPRSFPLFSGLAPSDWPEVDAIIFAGKTIPGYPVELPQVISGLENIKARLGVIEFTSQAGMDTLLRSARLQANVVRVHSISEKEIRDIEDEKHKVTLTGLVERWLRAVRERNVRLLYIQFFNKTINGDGLSLYDFNLGYLKQISSRLERSGFILDGVAATTAVPVRRLNIFLLGLGVLAALLLMLEQVFHWGESTLRFLLAGGILLFSLPLFLPAVTAAKFMALAASVIFPTWAMIAIQARIEKNPGPNYFKAAQVFTAGTALTLAGAILITGLLHGQYFWQKLGAFSGTKLALTLPPLLIFSWFVYTDRDYPWKKFWEQKVSYKHLLILAIVTGGLVIYLWRSGNNGSIFVSAQEEQLRGWLERVLWVRPRTKEFLFGHPLLLLAIFLGLKRRQNILLWLGGLIGQVSLLNTFCHAHTPLKISLLRSFNGWWLGLLAGWVLIWIYQRYIKTDEKGEQLCLKF